MSVKAKKKQDVLTYLGLGSRISMLNQQGCANIFRPVFAHFITGKSTISPEGDVDLMGSAYAICHAWVNRRKDPLQFMSPNPPPEVIQKPEQLQILEHVHDPLTTQKKH